MKTTSTIFILCSLLLGSQVSFADLGDKGVRSKKTTTKKVVEKLETVQSTWKFEPIATLQPIALVRSIDANMPAFITEEEQMDFVRTHKKLVMLSWLIAEPKAGAMYIIERGSYDFNDYVEIGRIDPSQRNTEALSNFFMDTEAPIGLYQYRIVEQVDCQATATFTPQTITKFIDNPASISLKANIK